MQTVYEALGRAEGVLRLAEAWHARVLADEVVGHAFGHGIHPEHTRRLAAYWTEALGGPQTYSATYGDESSVVRLHSGNGRHEELDRRAIACFDQAMADVGIAGGERLGQVLHDWFAWATTTAMARYPRSADDVPDGLPIPRWSWDGLVAQTRTVLVTGATSGLGRALATELAGLGWRVLAHGRDRARTEALATDIGARPLVADLAAQADVHRLAAQVLDSEPALHVLVNNAGVGFGPPGDGRSVGADGHELRLTVNYLAPVLLTRLLRPLLERSAPARVVNVGSVGQAPIDLDDIELTRSYDGVAAYRRSKLALAAHTFDLAQEWDPARVTVNCLHPASLMPTAMVLESGWPTRSEIGEGLVATRRLVVDPALDGVTGRFFDGTAESRARPEAYDPAFRARLREVTETLLDR